eukprot:15440707-Alexandrium_andersonii.AAC.1
MCAQGIAARGIPQADIGQLEVGCCDGEKQMFQKAEDWADEQTSDGARPSSDLESEGAQR